MLLIRRLSFLSFLWLISIASSQNRNGRIEKPTAVDREPEFIKRNRTADIVIQYMNLEAKPCEDFFEYACGKWIENRSSQGSGIMLTPQSEIETNVLKDLQAILSISEGQMSPAERKVLHFYQACATTRPTSPAQEMAMKTFKDQFGGRENYDWLSILARLRARFGLNILIAFDIDTNIETSRGNSIYLGEPQTTIIPPEYCNSAAIETMDIRDEFFEKLIEEVSKNMQKWLSMREHDAKHFGTDIVSFEFKLCKKMRMEKPSQDEEIEEENEVQPNSRRTPVNNVGQRRLHGKRYNGDIQRVYLNELTRYENIIDFKRYVTMVINLQQNEQIFLRDEPYLKHLAKLIRITTKITIGNYILYHILSEFNFPVGDASSQQDHCVRLVQKFFPKIAGEFYQRRFQRMDYRKETELYFTDIIKAFDESLKADWITENTKRAARQKLSQFKAHFPIYHNLDLNNLNFEQQDYWRKLQIVLEYNAKQDLERLANANPDERPHTIEAFDAGAQLMPMDNEIIVGWALLQQPFFENHYPRAMKYALLGQRLARELVLAFDEEGWRPTELSQRQWDAVTEEGFRNQSECYREQYSNYLYNNPDEFQNTTKLREIIAESSGLNLAFNAYLDWLANMDSRNRGLLSRETLPGINFTNTQLFFIHFAQTRCAAKPGESPPPKFLPLEQHTIQRYDVNGPLSNFVEFAREFGCTPGDEMHPVDKCVIY